MRSDAENLKYWQIRAAEARAMADATADAAAKQKMLDVAAGVYDKLAERAERVLNDAAKTMTRRPDYVAGTRDNVESWDLKLPSIRAPAALPPPSCALGSALRSLESEAVRRQAGGGLGLLGTSGGWAG
jgi:hypothetical protein